MLSARFILLSFAALIATFPAPGQSFGRCYLNDGGGARLLRVEGLTESWDQRISCRDGIPTPAGQAVPQVDLTVTLNTAITSRITASPFTEALLIIDEPHSFDHPLVPLRLCDPNNASSGICSILGNGTGEGTYDGSEGHPNVFQGRLISPNQLLFAAVPLDPPGIGKYRYLRFKNLRANTSSIGLVNDGNPHGVFTRVTSTPSNVLMYLIAPAADLGWIRTGSTAVLSAPAALSVCSGANTAIYNDASRPLGNGPQDGQQFPVVISEGFATSWKEKNIAVHLANSGSSVSFPADASQDVPGGDFWSESGFESIGISPAVLDSPPGYGPFLPTAPAFPSTRGLNVAGTADHGTRIYLQFSGVPSGAKIFVPVSLNSTVPGIATAGGKAVLVSSTGGAPFGPVTGVAAGLASLAVASGVATAVYEIAYSEPLFNEILTVPVAVAFNAGQPPAGAVYLLAGLGPWSTVGTADAGSPIPRFAPPSSRQLAFSLAACGTAALSVTTTHAGSFEQGQRGATYSVTVSNGRLASPSSGAVTLTEVMPSGLALVSMAGTGWTCAGMSCTRSDVLAPGASYPAVTVTVDVASNAGSPQVNTVSVSGGGAPANSATDPTVILAVTPPKYDLSKASSFYTVAPCRVADTRPSQGKTGPFGPPFLPANTNRDFPIASSPCGIPATARAFSLSMTVVPSGPLGYLSAYPAGQSFPGVSTLNSPAGTVIANAAIVVAGTNGAITAAASQGTELIVDANGYFGPIEKPSELMFFPLTPCRVVDTRPGQGKTGLFGPPALVANITRDIPMLASSCAIPSAAQAFALNVTVVPPAGLGYLSLWPAGQNFPGVSTLNSPDGATLANAAIVPAGANGAISVLASNAADLIVDVTGYFGVPVTGGLHFYSLKPCRVVDTRADQGKAGSFGPPGLAASAARTFPITASGCGVPAAARAYSLNVTAVPPGPLDFLSVWPTGQAYPGVSTLNSPAGRTIANAAIVAAGSSGSITVAAGKATELIIDINGYFAP